ncbi:hypothetical protein HOLDEFILI_03414 [Holdemania filiformis DSM 12042]|jgi:hypothetical protein|uniref:Uncharacterized protein n=1 Tax=Holdemania filiformis DSM 12042 TaxID=545696 RepID=B9YC55_9FIRM|nr:hypothetical protein HOLDEFILI_03414 [Holdemania filiformis DSM 12042]
MKINISETGIASACPLKQIGKAGFLPEGKQASRTKSVRDFQVRLALT